MSEQMDNALVIELSANGLTEQAGELEIASDLPALRQAIERALCAVSGALVVLWQYQAFLSGTGAVQHRRSLEALEASLLVRLGELSAERHREPEAILEAAMDWLQSECPLADVEALRVKARLELKRPRDELHRQWAEIFIKETERVSE